MQPIDEDLRFDVAVTGIHSGKFYEGAGVLVVDGSGLRIDRKPSVLKEALGVGGGASITWSGLRELRNGLASANAFEANFGHKRDAGLADPNIILNVKIRQPLELVPKLSQIFDSLPAEARARLCARELCGGAVLEGTCAKCGTVAKVEAGRQARSELVFGVVVGTAGVLFIPYQAQLATVAMLVGGFLLVRGIWKLATKKPA